MEIEFQPFKGAGAKLAGNSAFAGANFEFFEPSERFGAIET